MIYRLHFKPKGESQGFSFFESEALAEDYLDQLVDLMGYTRSDLQVDAVETPRTKAEVLLLLRNWASHPDNG